MKPRETNHVLSTSARKVRDASLIEILYIDTRDCAASLLPGLSWPLLKKIPMLKVKM